MSNSNHSNLVIIGVGGSGAKIIESLIQLASSSNAPTTIYPILFDQDIHNGNVEQCKRSIDTYIEIYNHVKSRNDRKTFLPNIIKISDSLLPISPTRSNISYKAAIGMASMKREERKLVKAIYNDFQLNDILDAGFKKRAYMGSVLIKKLLEEQDQLQPDEPGLKMIISKTSSFDNLNIVICGSIFGGTGSSGIVNIGRYFRSKVKNATISAIVMLPYFSISDNYSDDKDRGIVRSDSDMQLVNIALEMYRDGMKKFHNIFFIGSDINTVKDDFATIIAEPSGIKQTNPSHVFELIAASSTLYIPEKSGETKYFSFLVSPENNIKRPPFTFKATDLPKEINLKRLLWIKEFSRLLNISKDQEKSWKTRQPWIFKDPNFGILLNWAGRHHNWWSEMEVNSDNGQHLWKVFNVEKYEKMDVFKLSASLSQYLSGKEAKSINDIFYSLDRQIKE